MRYLTIGLAQCRQTNNFETNAQTILEYVEAAVQQKVQILCFPETQTVGYRADVTKADAPVPISKLESLHAKVSDRCRDARMACILGTETPNRSNPVHGKPYNSALVISEHGEILGVHHKNKLTPLDAVAYTPGTTFETFDLHGIHVGVVICFEGFRFPETTRECVGRGAQIVFHPQNNTTRPMDWKIPIHHAMITTRAAENTIWFASCNCCYPDYQNCCSMVVAPDGQTHAQAPLKQEKLLVTEIEIDRATRAMFKFEVDGCAEVLFADTIKPEEYRSSPVI